MSVHWLQREFVVALLQSGNATTVQYARDFMLLVEATTGDDERKLPYEASVDCVVTAAQALLDCVKVRRAFHVGERDV